MINKNLSNISTYLKEPFEPICKANSQERTVLRFNIPGILIPGKGSPREINIFSRNDNPDSLFMNIYNKWKKVAELKNVKVVKSEDETTFTYKNSDAIVDLYDKIDIKRSFINPSNNPIDNINNIKSITFKATNFNFNSDNNSGNNDILPEYHYPIDNNFASSNKLKEINDKGLYVLLGDLEEQDSSKPKSLACFSGET